MTALDEVYTERAHLVALLATHYPSFRIPAPDISEPGWWLVFLYVDTQQMSWHFSPQDSYLIADISIVPAYDWRVQWDGHTTAQKYARMRQSLRLMA